MQKYLRLFLIAIAFLTACTPPSAEETQVTITLEVDGTTNTYTVNSDSTVNDVLRQAGVALDDAGLDRVNPPGYSPVEEGMTITVRRVEEETIVEQVVVPFERRTTTNDDIPAGDTRLLQAGVNGLAEITYRITYEDGVEVARNEIRRVLIEAPQDEVVMVGSQSELPTITVDGTIVYISAGNAWIVRQNSANARPLTTEGGIDARVFDLSHDGTALLFTRTLSAEESEQDDEETAESEDGIIGAPTAIPTPVSTLAPDETPTEEPLNIGPSFNRLSVILDTTDLEAGSVDIDLENILYAEFVPGSSRIIVYSTAEPRSSFPGWQANNDLWIAQLADDGTIFQSQQLIEPSSGGIYGWYGTFFSFAPDSISLSWAQPDEVGLLSPVFLDPDAAQEDLEPTPTIEASLVDQIEENPLFQLDYFLTEQTIGFAPRNAYDFVWVPPSMSWSPDGEYLATVTHGDPLGAETAEDSPVFNLTFISLTGGYTINVVERAGMWAFPLFAPQINEETGYARIAYLQAVEPLNSAVSPYELVLMDQDGSNKQVVFPDEDSLPMSSGPFTWSPDGLQIAVTYHGNIFLIDTLTGFHQQLTGDGTSHSPQWAP